MNKKSLTIIGFTVVLIGLAFLNIFFLITSKALINQQKAKKTITVSKDSNVDLIGNKEKGVSLLELGLEKTAELKQDINLRHHEKHDGEIEIKDAPEVKSAPPSHYPQAAATNHPEKQVQEEIQILKKTEVEDTNVEIHPKEQQVKASPTSHYPQAAATNHPEKQVTEDPNMKDDDTHHDYHNKDETVVDVPINGNAEDNIPQDSVDPRNQVNIEIPLPGFNHTNHTNCGHSSWNNTYGENESVAENLPPIPGVNKNLTIPGTDKDVSLNVTKSKYDKDTDVTIPLSPTAPPKVTDVPDRSQSPPVRDVPDQTQSPPVRDVPDRSQAPPKDNVPDQTQSPPVNNIPDQNQAPPMNNIPDTNKNELDQKFHVADDEFHKGENALHSGNNQPNDNKQHQRDNKLHIDDETYHRASQFKYILDTDGTKLYEKDMVEYARAKGGDFADELLQEIAKEENEE
jgi:hypothetical protein